MKKRISIASDDQDIPELQREQLGTGVRGKYFQRTLRNSNIVILQPEIMKAFSTSEAVNKALASLLTFTRETQSLTTHSKKTPRRQSDEMGEYNTIKELVVDTYMSEGGFPSYEKLTSLVLKNFPNSKWQKSHYAWYKSRIKRGEIKVP